MVVRVQVDDVLSPADRRLSGVVRDIQVDGMLALQLRIERVEAVK
jgi:hypothetical protein